VRFFNSRRYFGFNVQFPPKIERTGICVPFDLAVGVTQVVLRPGGSITEELGTGIW
jgi:hypothetical protein